MIPTWDHARLIELTGLLCDERITDAEFAELSQLLEDHADARRLYQVCIATHLRIEQAGAEMLRLPTLARSASEGVSPSPTRSVSEESIPHAPREAGHHAERDGYYRFRITAIAAVVAFIAIGILAYSFWPGPVAPRVVKQTDANIPAATIANLTDAKWAGVSSQTGDTLNAGQQLLLQSGSVEITFNTQARVIVEGPAELTIVDAAACRLATGRLTAHVPDSAKGFQVHTPDGTVTDLGTEFGVVVRGQGSESRGRASGIRGQESGVRDQGEERKANHTSTTEVHVFQGKVELTQAHEGDSPTQSEITNLKSEILSAGQAVTISANKIERLPAADPFKFQPETFDGRSRTTLFADDFEAMRVGDSGRMIGQWKTAYASPQEIHVVDPAPGAAAVASTLPPVGHRAMEIRSDRRKTKNMNPFMVAKVDRPKVPADCRLLIECDICPRTAEIEPSIQISGKLPLRLAPSIELAREPDPQAPQVSWQVHQWYRVRLVRNIVADVLREATFERQVWRGADGWVRDLAIGLPAPKDQDRYSGQVWLGFPAPLVGQAGGTFWLDNVRVEVLGEK